MVGKSSIEGCAERTVPAMRVRGDIFAVGDVAFSAVVRIPSQSVSLKGAAI